MSSISTFGPAGKAVCVAGLAIFAITHPVIGILAQPILGIKAIAHVIFLNYHWHQSKNDQGVALCNDYQEKSERPKYMNKMEKFEAKDLTRLEHEEKRIESRDQLFKTLKWMKGLAKCIIPIVGLLWAYTSEDMTTWMSTTKLPANPDRQTDAQIIKEYIAKLKAEFPQHKVSAYV